MIVLIRDWLEASQMSVLCTEDYCCSSVFVEFAFICSADSETL